MSLFDLWLIGIVASGVFLGNLVYDVVKSAVKRMKK